MAETDDLLSRLRGLAEKATPAPWEPFDFDGAQLLIRGPAYDGGKHELVAKLTLDKKHDNLALIVALRNDWPSLLSRIECADKMRAAIRATTTHPCKASETELAEALRAYDATMREAGNHPGPTT